MNEKLFQGNIIEWKGSGIYGKAVASVAYSWEPHWVKLTSLDAVATALELGRPIAYVHESDITDQ